MTRSLRLSCLVCILVAVGSGCELVRTEDSENSVGRGAKAFDPYAASASGAIKLSLQMFNGCAVLATGVPVQKGAANIPYPSKCPDSNTQDLSPTTPTGTLKLVTDTDYFLNQLTLTDTVVNAHTDPTNPDVPLQWMETQSRFKDLDWRGVGVALDQWRPDDGPSWIREVFFGNANWMVPQDDYFDVDVLDQDGKTVRATQRYLHKEFLGESPFAGHSRVSWQMSGAARPQFPGDLQIHNPPGSPPTFRTIVRLDMVGSTNPFKTFKVVGSGLAGTQGAIRVTWSQLGPDKAFYFPVTFISPSEIPSTCFGGSSGSAPVPCGFGLDPQVTLSAPKNGKGYYEPGESFDLFMTIKDGDGNALHLPGGLPSFNSFMASTGNGLLYTSPGFELNSLEKDQQSDFKVIGPLQDLRPEGDVTVPPSYSEFPATTSSSFDEPLMDPIAALGLVPKLADVPWPTRRPISLPQNARSGTYVALLKTHRQFLGERVTRTNAFFFQVGQAEPTSYPGRVGNCQICHRGVLSLDNLRHGLSVDHVEACKACHANVGLNFTTDVHRIHSFSNKYPLPKNDCTVCHLTRESALRPSIELCSSCHPSLHGSDYFQAEFAKYSIPNRYGDCAESCHVVKAPSGHIVPEN